MNFIRFATVVSLVSLILYSSAVMAENSSHSPFVRALLEKQKARNGIQPPPETILPSATNIQAQEPVTPPVTEHADTAPAPLALPVPILEEMAAPPPAPAEEPRAPVLAMPDKQVVSDQIIWDTPRPETKQPSVSVTDENKAVQTLPATVMETPVPTTAGERIKAKAGANPCPQGMEVDPLAAAYCRVRILEDGSLDPSACPDGKRPDAFGCME